jgi:glycosyltransferase involved in cell wall biosynthesis
MRQRILYILRKFRRASGTARVVTDIVSGLDRSLYEPFLCVFDPGASHEERFPDLNASVVDAQMRRSGERFQRWDMSFLARLVRDVRRRRIGLIHSHCLEGLWYGAACKLICGPGLVHTFHEPFSVGQQRTRSGRLMRVLADSTDALVAVSHTQGSAFCELFSLAEEFFSTVHNGVDCRRLRPDPKARREARQELRAGDDTILLGAVAKLARVKNFPLMLRAFVRIRGTRPECRLIIAGDGSERARLEELARRLDLQDDVRFLGARDDVPRLMNAFDLFLMTSKVESYGCVLGEAAASGVPVVTTAAGGAREVVQEGVSGDVVLADEPDRFAEAVLNLLSDPDRLRAMGRAAREHAAANLSIDRMIERYHRLYEHCLAGIRQRGADRLFPLEPVAARLHAP